MQQLTEQLIESLKQRQQELDLSDREMADRLGVSQPLWVRARLGDYRIERSILLLRGAIRAFPDLEGEALAVLRGDRTQEEEGVA